MTSDRPTANHEIAVLLDQYKKWQTIFSHAGYLLPNEPVWEDQRLHFRNGYPYEGWTSNIIEPLDRGCNVFRATTERRNEPLEGLAAFFSDITDAGKYILWNAGESFRMAQRVDPIEWTWDAEGLDPRVRQIPLERYISKFELRVDPSRFFVLQAGGIQPENHLLPLTYEELNEQLLSGLPESIVSAADKSFR